MPRRGRGRPAGTLKLNSVIDRHDDGTPITVRERIIAWIGAGCPQDMAAAKAGIGASTIKGWMRDAAAIVERQTVNPYSRLTHHEQDLVNFSAECERARAEHASRLLGIVNQHAEGGLEKTTKRLREKVDNSGAVIERERHVITETALPSESAAKWLLERQHGMSQPIELRVERGVLDDDTRLAELATAMREFVAERRGLAEGDGVIDVDSEEVE